MTAGAPPRTRMLVVSGALATMDMLGEGSWIEFKGDTLTTFSVRREYVSEARFSSEMCVLASHLERLTGAE